MQRLRTDKINDPELQRSRQINKERLRYAFEDIIGKYSRDFSAFGDEVNLETGEITVNNGHIARMQNEHDTGDQKKRFIRNYIQDVNRPSPMSQQFHQTPEEQEWEDVDEMEDEDEEHTDNRDAFQEEFRQSEDEELEEAYGEEFQPSYTQSYRPPLPPNHRSYNNPNSLNNINANREMIREFADSIANQISDFLFFFAGSIQNQQTTQPPHRPPSMPARSQSRSNNLPQSRPSHNDYDRQPSFSSRSMKRQKTASEDHRHHHHQDNHFHEPQTSRTHDKAPINRLSALRSEAQATPMRPKHGHRGLTPGMPSLWSGAEDSDHGPKRKGHDKPKSRRPMLAPQAISRPPKSSSLRTENALTSLSGRADDQITVQRSASSTMPKSVNQMYDSLRDKTKEPRYASMEIDDEMELDRTERHASYIPDTEEDEDVGDETNINLPENNVRKYNPRFEFTKEDDDLIIKLKAEGLTYKDIAAHLPHTPHQIMYRWTKFLKMGIRKGVYRRVKQLNAEESKNIPKKRKIMTFSKTPNEILDEERGVSEDYDPEDEELDRTEFGTEDEIADSPTDEPNRGAAVRMSPSSRGAFEEDEQDEQKPIIALSDDEDEAKDNEEAIDDDESLIDPALRSKPSSKTREGSINSKSPLTTENGSSSKGNIPSQKTGNANSAKGLVNEPTIDKIERENIQRHDNETVSSTFTVKGRISSVDSPKAKQRSYLLMENTNGEFDRIESI